MKIRKNRQVIKEQAAVAIRRHREATSTSQQTLATMIGVSQPLVSAWECGKIAPSIEDLVSIEDALAISRGTLFFEIANGVTKN